MISSLVAALMNRCTFSRLLVGIRRTGSKGMRPAMDVTIICTVILRDLVNDLVRLLRRGSVVEPHEVVAVHLLVEHGEVALDLLRVQRVCLLIVQVAQLLRLRDADTEAVVLGQRRGMGIRVADVRQLTIAATACQKRIESCLQLREIQRLVRKNLLPLCLKLLRTVLLRYLPQQFEPRILNTVSVKILNVYHKENFLNANYH